MRVNDKPKKTHGIYNKEENSAPIWGATCPTEANNIPKREKNKTSNSDRCTKNNNTPITNIHRASIGENTAQLD